jgi:hypothetical protein
MDNFDEEYKRIREINVTHLVSNELHLKSKEFRDAYRIRSKKERHNAYMLHSRDKVNENRRNKRREQRREQKRQIVIEVPVEEPVEEPEIKKIIIVEPLEIPDEIQAHINDKASEILLFENRIIYKLILMIPQIRIADISFIRIATSDAHMKSIKNNEIFNWYFNDTIIVNMPKKQIHYKVPHELATEINNRILRKPSAELSWGVGTYKLYYKMYKVMIKEMYGKLFGVKNLREYVFSTSSD